MLRSWLFIPLSILLMVGCSNQEDTQAEKKATKQEQGQKVDHKEKNDSWFEKFEKAPDSRVTPASLANQPMGPYGDASLASNPDGYPKLIKKFDDIPKDATEEELKKVFDYAVAQLSVDLPDPQSVIDTWKVGSFGDPELEDTRYHFKENYNIEVILDSSGSMKHVINGKSRMEIAKEAIQSFLKEAPPQAKVALRVYGHKGTGSDKDKQMSCASSELVYNFDTFKEADFSKALGSFQPAGWTPLAQSLKDAQEDLKQFDGATNTNMIYVVSDGIETCDGDPVATAKGLANSNLKPIINIIGFDVDEKGQKQLKEMANAANGTYSNVTSADQLKTEFERAKGALEKWKIWKRDADYTADIERNRRFLDTSKLDTDYILILQRQKDNLIFLFQELRQQKKITGEQWEFLDNKRNEIEKQMNEARITIKNDLSDLNAKTLEETKKQIQEKYDQNTK